MTDLQLARRLRRFNPQDGSRTHFLIAERSHPRRSEVEKFIANVFRKVYQAQVTQFAPLLLALCDGDRLLGAVGIRSATMEPLFVQQYLDARVDQVVAGAEHQPVNGDDIAEIGNLAVMRPGTGALLFAALCQLLTHQNYRWVICNATPGVQNLFNKLKFPVTAVVRADKTRLTGGYQHWGSYYQRPSTILVTSVAACHKALTQDPELAEINTRLAPLLDDLIGIPVYSK